MTIENCSASSCAVENYSGRIRLSLVFRHIGEYINAEQAVRKNPEFEIDTSNPKKGGTCNGSKLVVLLDPAFAKSAADTFGAFYIRSGIEYVNGSKQKCKSVAEAVGMALDHP